MIEEVKAKIGRDIVKSFWLKIIVLIRPAKGIHEILVQIYGESYVGNKSVLLLMNIKKN